MSETEDARAALDRLRVSLKFTLWAWAFYWPGGGLLLLYGGLDPIAILVTFSSLAAFIALAFFGGLSSQSSRNRFEFFLERPLYVILALIVLIIGATMFTALESIGLTLMSGLLVASLVLLGVRAAEYTRAVGTTAFQARTDQVFIVVALCVASSFMIFLDAALTINGGDATDTPANMVAMINWLNLLFPPMALVATRGLREPLRWRRPAITTDDTPGVPS